MTALVYPDVYAAQRVVVALRRGRFRDPGLRTRGPLGLGTDFESIRDYQPDDDVRQINWTASSRTGRPMSNVYRIEQDRDVVCLLDAGRLMSAPLDATSTRLDACVDAVTMVALVADELGDRCGVTVFDAEIRKRLGAAAQRRPGRHPHDPRRRTTRSRKRPRSRVPHRRRGQAFARHRVHRPCRRGGGPFTARSGPGAGPSARGRRRVGSRSRSRLRGRARTTRRRTTCTRPPSRSTCSTPGARSSRACGTAVPKSWRPRPQHLGDACVARLSHAEGASSVVAAGFPRQNTSPQ